MEIYWELNYLKYFTRYYIKLTGAWEVCWYLAHFLPDRCACWDWVHLSNNVILATDCKLSLSGASNTDEDGTELNTMVTSGIQLHPHTGLLSRSTAKLTCCWALKRVIKSTSVSIPAVALVKVSADDHFLLQGLQKEHNSIQCSKNGLQLWFINGKCGY